MQVEIIETPLKLTIHGYGGTALDNDYAGMAFKLMDKMWQTVKSNQLKNKGLNVWIYDVNKQVFAGVELTEPASKETALQEKQISVSRYAYCKHIGPYQLIKNAKQVMDATVARQGYVPTMPYIEIYGHWTNDESKLDTELLQVLQ